MTAPCILRALLALYAIAAPVAAQDFVTERGAVQVTTVAEGLERPWSLAFLPDGRMLVTERPGRLRIVTQEGAVSAPIAGVPAVVAQGQGGLLDVVLDPEHATNGRIYLSYAEDRGSGTNATAVMRARLSGMMLEEPQIIFRQQPAVESPAHFGGRLVFGRDGRLFVTLGERAGRHFIDRAQSLDDHFGKIIRIEQPEVIRGQFGRRGGQWPAGPAATRFVQQ